MKTLISTFAVILALSTTAFADDSPAPLTCVEMVKNEAALIAPAKPIANAVVMSEDIVAILTPGKDYLSDSVHSVDASYDFMTALHASLRDNFADHGALIGVVESPAGNGNPALWVQVWSQGQDACVTSIVDDRVYDERGNAPNIFWDAVTTWEKEHPQNVLVRASAN